MMDGCLERRRKKKGEGETGEIDEQSKKRSSSGFYCKRFPKYEGGMGVTLITRTGFILIKLNNEQHPAFQNY